MIRFHLRDILRGTGGSLITSAVGQELFTGISTDSRTVRPGEVFVALKGRFHDGHDHLREARDRGAALTVVQGDAVREQDRLAPVPVVVVQDTLEALQSLASFWRARHEIPVLAVVGSVGKTTTKEMIASILSLSGPCLKNPGNFNNIVGLPLSLLALADFHNFAVLEIGANQPGEIRHLSSLLQPVAAVVTRLGWAHLEGFGTSEKLVQEKGSVLEEVPADGWCAVNADDPSHGSFAERASCRVITYGIESGEVTAEGIILSAAETSFILVTPVSRERVQLKAFGRHFVENALAAVAAVLPLQIPMEQVVAGLGSWKPSDQRGGIVTPRPGVHFIDDTYNANPLSVRAALSSLAQLRYEGVTVAVLGEMKELGDYFEEGHRTVGRDAAETGVDYLIAVGPYAGIMADGALQAGMDPSRVLQCRSREEAVRCLEPLLTEGVWVLFKGSRAAEMERIMEPFLETRSLSGSGGL